MPLLEERIQRAQQGDVKEREQLILDNIPLVWSMVGRFHYLGRDKDELFQIGMVGLMQAVDRFDVGFGVQFSTYAVPLIIGEIRRFLRDDAPVKITRSVMENRKRIRELMDAEGDLNVEEIVARLHISMEDVILALESDKPVESIYEPVYDSGESQVYLVDKLEQQEKPIEEQVMERELIEQAFSTLDGREQRMIKLRFYENKTQSQVGELMEMTQVQVSRMEKKILLKMRKGIQEMPCK